MITIISKIEGHEEGFIQTPIGQTTDPAIIKSINEDYDSKLGKFIGENLTKLDAREITYIGFFEVHNIVYEARETTTHDDNLYPNITNINQL